MTLSPRATWKCGTLPAIRTGWGDLAAATTTQIHGGDVVVCLALPRSTRVTAERSPDRVCRAHRSLRNGPRAKIERSAARHHEAARRNPTPPCASKRTRNRRARRSRRSGASGRSCIRRARIFPLRAAADDDGDSGDCDPRHSSAFHRTLLQHRPGLCQPIAEPTAMNQSPRIGASSEYRPYHSDRLPACR